MFSLKQSLLFKSLISLGEPADYEERVSADAPDALDPHHFSMEDADRILNDDEMDMAPSTADHKTPPPSTSSPQTLLSRLCNQTAIGHGFFGQLIGLVKEI
jgi:hypothetical protein